MPITIAWYNASEKSISSLFDCTPNDILDVVYNAENETKSQFYHRISENCNTELICFLSGDIKFEEHWLAELINVVPMTGFAIPVVNDLNVNWWLAQSQVLKSPVFKWDLEFYNSTRPDSPCIAPHCYIARTKWVKRIGNFAVFTENGHEEIETSIRNYCYGGRVTRSDSSHISAEIGKGIRSLRNKKMIIETWLTKYSKICNMVISGLSETKIVDKLPCIEGIVESVDNFISYGMPELLSSYQLMLRHVGSDVCVLGCGPSMSFMPERLWLGFKVIIGVDYMAKLYKCDYVYTNDLKVIEDLSGIYKEEQFIVPAVIKDHDGKPLNSLDVLGRASVVDVVTIGTYNGFTPLKEFGDNSLTAVQAAVLMGAGNVVLFGDDYKLLNGCSHDSNIEEYNYGKCFPDNDWVRDGLSKREENIRVLGDILRASGINLFRMNSA